jgi:Ras family protein A
MERRAKGKRKTLLNLLSRKRKRREQELEVPREPVRLNFLFVGSKGAGQTSLLLWVAQKTRLIYLLTLYSRSRYGYFPDASSTPLLTLKAANMW